MIGSPLLSVRPGGCWTGPFGGLGGVGAGSVGRLGSGDMGRRLFKGYVGKSEANEQCGAEEERGEACDVQAFRDPVSQQLRWVASSFVTVVRIEQIYVGQMCARS